MPRVARIILPGYPHHVVQRGNNKQYVFFSDEDRERYIDLLRKYSSQFNCIINAYCLMNNHVHTLLVPGNTKALSKTMHRLGLTYAQYINRKYNRTGRLWETRFHSSLVDRDAYLWIVCRYIERNPVRAGIVLYPKDYKWSSVRCSISERDRSFVKSPWQDPEDKEEYIKFLNTPENIEEVEMIERANKNSSPIISENFFRSVAKDLSIKASSHMPRVSSIAK